MKTTTDSPLGKPPRQSRPRAVGRFRWCARIAFALYLALLTVLLLTRDPTALVGTPPALLELLGSIAHLLSFLVLGTLAMAAGLSRSAWTPIFWLTVYASATELLQQFNARSPEWGDWLQDLAGICLGVLLYQLGATLFWPGRTGENRPPPPPEAVGSDRPS